MAPKNDLDSRLQARVESFVEDISSIVRESALETLRDALVGDGIPMRRSATPTRRAATSARKAAPKKRNGRRIRRSADDLNQLAGTILSHVASNPGQRLEQIGAELRVATADLKRPVFLLLEGKKLRTTGQRRGTKYFTKGKVKK